MSKVFVINARGQYSGKIYALNIEAGDRQIVEDVVSDLGLVVADDGIGEVPQFNDALDDVDSAFEDILP